MRMQTHQERVLLRDRAYQQGCGRMRRGVPAEATGGQEAEGYRARATEEGGAA